MSLVIMLVCSCWLLDVGSTCLIGTVDSQIEGSSLNMIIGIQKRQMFLLLLVLSVPLLLNAVAIWQDVGTDVILQILRGTYSPYPQRLVGVTHNPLLEIFLNLLPFAALLGLLAWLVVFISNKSFFQKQPPVAKFCETLLMTLLVAVIFTFVTDFFMPLVWLPRFHDSLGLPGSAFMHYWSLWLVFPTTTFILVGAVFLAGNRKIYTPSTTA